MKWPVGILTLALVLLAWVAVDRFGNVQEVEFPHLQAVVDASRSLISSGELLHQTLESLKRLAIGVAIGSVLGMVTGLAMASSRRLADFVRPLVLFFQAIAGIAWIPLAIIWFGLGSGAVVFVVANAVFFIVLFNVLVGIQHIPQVLILATQTLGADRARIMREVIVPGALVYLLIGLETAMAFAWRALVAAEIIVASNGLGFLTTQASARFDTATVVVGIITIGLLWLAMQRLLLAPLRVHTVERWGMTQALHE